MWKAESPIDLSELCRLTSLSALPFSNARLSIVVTLVGMVIEDKPAPWKANSGIVVTELGMVQEVNRRQLANADLPKCLNPSGRVIDVKYEQP